MSFSDAQIRALQRNVPSRNLRSRIRDGKELTYLEGWYAVHTANRIFGFDGWDRETVETRCVVAREARGSYSVVYAAKVRISVRIGEHVIIRDGHGTGESRGGSPGDAHDLALKAAETDATKRALATFGRAFGLSLHANGRVKPSGASIGAAANMSQPEVPTDDTVGRADDHPDQVSRRQGGEEATLAHKHVPASSATKPILRQLEMASSVFAKREVKLSLPQVRIDKSALPQPEPQRIRDKAHLRYVTTQACLLCGIRPSDAHHLRFAQPRALGRKVSDKFTVPLCRTHHRQLHQSGNEVSWWHDMGIDSIAVAEQLWSETQAT